MNTTQKLKNADQIMMLAPQLLRFNPKNCLLLSIVVCAPSQSSEVKSNLEYCAEFENKQNYLCPVCQQKRPHSIQSILLSDLEEINLCQLKTQILSQTKNKPISLISIDWYCEDLYRSLADRNIFTKLWQINKAIQEFQSTASLVAHLCDYKYWIRLTPQIIKAKMMQRKQCTDKADFAADGSSLSFLAANLHQCIRFENPEPTEIRDNFDLKITNISAVAQRNTDEKLKLKICSAVQKIKSINQSQSFALMYEIRNGKQQENTRSKKIIAGKKIWEEILFSDPKPYFTSSELEKNTDFAKDACNEAKIELLARLLNACEEIEIRDSILVYALCPSIFSLTNLEPEKISEYLHKAGDYAAPILRIKKVIAQLASIAVFSCGTDVALYAAIAYLYWWIECPVLALENARYALQFNPDYTLAKLVLRAAAAQVPPPWK